MSDSIKAVIVPAEVRQQCARIAAIEAKYWGELDDDRIALIAIGAMGAAANICAAILAERTPDEHKTECANRGKNSFNL